MSPERKQLERTLQALAEAAPGLGSQVAETAQAAVQVELSRLARRSGGDSLRWVTLLQGDLAGFTALSERLDPEEVRDRLARIWERVDPILARRGGKVLGHLGDSVQAVFGVPAAAEDDSLRAVQAGLEILAALEELEQGQDALRMRIGLHRGRVMVSPLDVDDGWLVMGEAVAEVAAVEARSPVGRLAVSEPVWTQVSRYFEGQRLPEVDPDSPLSLHAIVATRPSASDTGPGSLEAGSAETPFFGRKALLEALHGALAEVRERGTARYLVLTGDAGMGRSRLLANFLEEVGAAGGPVAVHHLRASMQTREVGLGVLRTWLGSRLDLRDLPEGGELVGYLGGLSGLNPHGAGRLLTAIGHLAGAGKTPSLSSRNSDSIPLLGDLLGDAFRRGGLPQVVILDDLHWADEATLDLLDYLWTRVADDPVLAVLSGRPRLLEQRPGWTEPEPPHRRLTMTPLSEEETRTLVASILGGDPTSDPRIEEIARAAGGNPLYAVELARQAKEAVSPATNNRGGLQIPTSLDAVLQARLDHLPENLRSVLEVAAVAGGSFDEELLENMDPEGAAFHREALQDLAERGLIDPLASVTGGSWTFRSQLLRDVAEHNLVRTRARGLHRRAAKFLESHRGGALGTSPVEIGQHWLAAGEAKQAAFLFLDAANRTSAPLSLDLSRRLLERVEETLPREEATSPLRLATLAGICRIAALLSDHDPISEAARKLETTSIEADNGLYEARALHTLAVLDWQKGERRLALERARRALSRLENIDPDSWGHPADGPTVLRALLYEVVAWCHLSLGEIVEATQQTALLSRTIETAQPEEAAHFRLRAARLEATLLVIRGQFRLARTRIDGVLAALKEREYLRGQAALVLTAAECLDLQGDLEGATHRYQEVLDSAQRMASDHSREAAIIGLARMELALGRPGQARARLVELESLTPQSWYLRAEFLAALSLCQVAVGLSEEALALAQEALEASAALDSEEERVRVIRMAANVASRLDRPLRLKGEERDARELLELALARIDPTVYPVEALRITFSLFRHLQRRGDPEATDLEEDLLESAARFEMVLHDDIGEVE